MKVEFVVNAQPQTLDVSPYRRLLDVLRQDLALTGTKEGCGEGECGACSVTLDGQIVNSCLVAVGQCHGRSVGTVEGLAAHGDSGEVLNAVQRALIQLGGAQCGICTPGIAMCATEILARNLVPAATDDAGIAAARATVRTLLAGNLCRCTGYQLIVDAVIAAAAEVQQRQTMRGGK